MPVETLAPAVVSASAPSAGAAAGAAGMSLSGVAGIGGLLYQIFKDRHLTGAQREANAFTEHMAQQQMNFEAGQAQQQMDFQERMANTQWQRGVADMQAAGLNPALAYSQGGAVAPSGAMASGSSGSSVDPGRGLSMSDFLSAISFRKEMEMKDAQIESLNQDIEGKRIDNEIKAIDLEYHPEFNALQVRHLTEQINYLIEQGNMSRYQRQVVLPAQVALAKAQELVAKGEAKKISAELVYTLWKNEFYKRNKFWPGQSAGTMFWSMISGAIDSSAQMPDELKLPAVGFSYP